MSTQKSVLQLYVFSRVKSAILSWLRSSLYRPLRPINWWVGVYTILACAGGVRATRLTPAALAASAYLLRRCWTDWEKGAGALRDGLMGYSSEGGMARLDYRSILF